MNIKIELGMLMRDRVTLLEGVVVAILHELNCVDRVELQPQGDGKTFPEGRIIDITGLEPTDEPKVIDIKTPEAKYKLGIKAECGVTGFKGVVVAISKMINGCTGYILTKNFDEGLFSNKSVLRHQVLEPNLLVAEKPEVQVEHKKTGKGCLTQGRDDYYGSVK